MLWKVKSVVPLFNMTKDIHVYRDKFSINLIFMNNSNRLTKLFDFSFMSSFIYLEISRQSLNILMEIRNGYLSELEFII